MSGILENLAAFNEVLKTLKDTIAEATQEVVRYRKAGSNGLDRAKAVASLDRIVSDIEFSAGHLRVEFDHLAGKKGKYEDDEEKGGAR